MLTLTLNPALDVSATVRALEPDRKMYANDVVEHPGGGGINVARVARRLGAHVVAVVVEGGATCEKVIELTCAEGVQVEPVHSDADTRRNLTVVDHSSSRQYRFIMPGPTVTTVCLDAALAALLRHMSSPSVVVISGSLPRGVEPDAVAEIATRMRDAGGALVVDVPGDVLAAMAAIGTVLLKPSVRELEQFIGRSLGSHAEIGQAARSLLSLGPNRAAIVSRGATGALLVRPDESTLWLHAPRVRTVSTVGAGDSLVAACAVALERGMTMVDAARYGVAAGSAETVTAGTGLCDAATVERLRHLVGMSEMA